MKSTLLTLIIAALLPWQVLATETTATPQTIILNPTTLRTHLMADGLPLLVAANRVHKAKDSVNLARSKLLPSLNLGVLAGSLVNPTFLLASVEYVLPFLIPSKWFDAAKEKHLAEAEKAAFLLTELNVYASLFSLYYTVSLDMQTREFLALDFRDTVLVEQIVERAYEDGRATETDLNLARSQTASAQARLARLNELLVDEIATIKQSIGLPVDATVFFEKSALPASQMEELPMQSAIQLALQKAPESQQIAQLVEAAKYERWSKTFGFIIGTSASNTVAGLTGDSASFAFSAQSIGGAFNFGFDYFPNISLSNRNLEAIQLRELELKSEVSRLVESMQGRFSFVQARLRETTMSESLLYKVYENDQKRYSAGDITLSELVQSMGRFRQAGLERLRAETDQQLIRVSTHRILVSDQFAEIKGCEDLPKVEKKKSGWRWPWESAEDEVSICDPEAVAKRLNGNS